MSLTVKECQNFKPLLKPYKKADSQGLYLEIFPNGSKYWRLKYRFGGREKRLALGVFPEVFLQEARDGREVARRKLREGIHPSEEKKSLKRNKQMVSKGLFGIVANSWHAQRYSATYFDAHLCRLSTFHQCAFKFINDYNSCANPAYP